MQQKQNRRCHPGSELHYISTPAFSRRMLGNGPTYSATQRRLVSCPICDTALQQRNLRQHLITQHQVFERPSKRPKSSIPSQQAPNTYNISMPPRTWTSCPVPNCDGRAGTRDSMRVHFAHRHPFDIIIIDEEAPYPDAKGATCLFLCLQQSLTPSLSVVLWSRKKAKASSRNRQHPGTEHILPGWRFRT
jgi:hypothetical protein